MLLHRLLLGVLILLLQTTTTFEVNAYGDVVKEKIVRTEKATGSKPLVEKEKAKKERKKKKQAHKKKHKKPNRTQQQQSVNPHRYFNTGLVFYFLQMLGGAASILGIVNLAGTGLAAAIVAALLALLMFMVLIVLTILIFFYIGVAVAAIRRKLGIEGHNRYSAMVITWVIINVLVMFLMMILLLANAWILLAIAGGVLLAGTILMLLGINGLRNMDEGRKYID